jgi:putative tryptophan/tyrosine transport system substrate-binding protein
VRRRSFLVGVGGALAAAPFAVRAQAPPSRRLAVLMVIADRPVSRSRVAATIDALRAVGWIEGQNLTVDVRFGASDPERIRRATEELLRLEPDVVLAQGVIGAGALQRATKTVPVVFVQVQDPVGGGFVTSLSRPEANLTGFTNFDYAMVGKWMALLKEVAPSLTRVLAIVLPDATTGDHAGVIIAEAARHRLPAVYPYDIQAQQGGLVAYTSSVRDQYSAAAGYIDRLLRGAKPGDLPVQAAERFVTILNLRTAAALGLQIPPTILATIDEVIE